MPAYMPEGDTPLPFDNEVRSLQKIVSLGGGGGGGGGVNLVTSPPAASDPVGIYWDSTDKNLYVVDVDGVNIH